MGWVWGHIDWYGAFSYGVGNWVWDWRGGSSWMYIDGLNIVHRLSLLLGVL